MHARVYDHAGSGGPLAISRPFRIAFRWIDGVGTRDKISFAAQWLACMLPCQRFAHSLTAARA